MRPGTEGLTQVATYVDLPDGYEVLRDPKTGRYSIIVPDGKIFGSHCTLDLAERSAERHYLKSKGKERKCISCPRLFNSTGPGHRMCAWCRADACDTSGGC